MEKNIKIIIGVIVGIIIISSIILYYYFKPNQIILVQEKKPEPIIPSPGTPISGCTHCGNGFYACKDKRVSTYRVPQYDPETPQVIIDNYALYLRDGITTGCDVVEKKSTTSDVNIQNPTTSGTNIQKPDTPKKNLVMIKNKQTQKCITTSNPSKNMGNCSQEWIFDTSGKDSKIQVNPELNFESFIPPNNFCLTSVSPFSNTYKTDITKPTPSDFDPNKIYFTDPGKCTENDINLYWKFKNNNLIHSSTNLCLDVVDDMRTLNKCNKSNTQKWIIT